MISRHLRFASICAIAVALSYGSTARAQQAAIAPAPAFMPPMSQNGGGDNEGWNADNVNRKDLREEMEQIRKQHEELEAAREHLRAKCGPMQPPPGMGGPGSSPNPGTQGAQGTPQPQQGGMPPMRGSPECEQERQDLRAQFEQFHERRQAFRAKMDELRAAHPNGQGPFGMNGQNFRSPPAGGPVNGGPTGQPPQPPPPTGSPGAVPGGSAPFGPAPDR